MSKSLQNTDELTHETVVTYVRVSTEDQDPDTHRNEVNEFVEQEYPEANQEEFADIWTGTTTIGREQFGELKAKIQEESIDADTKQLLEDIIHESPHTEFLVTSDHGYVNQLGNSPYSVDDKQEDALSKKFSGRFCEVGNSQAYMMLEEANIIRKMGEHYVVQGHYDWTKPGATKKISHGGLSLIECMTPVLEVKT